MIKSPIKPKTAAQAFLDPFETLSSQTVKPMASNFMEQLGGKALGGIFSPTTMAHEELSRARKEKELEEKSHSDHQDSDENAQKIIQSIQTEYRSHQQTTAKEQKELKQEVVELQQEVVKLAKTAGVDTKAHLETMPKKIGAIDIKRLTAIVRMLRFKATEAKSGSELVSQRSNAKRPTGMLAWVSGKQMKIHEQGTMQLQG